MKSEQIKHSLSVGIKSIQSRVFDRETDEVISFVKIPIADSGLVRCEKGTREMTKPRLDQGADYERGFVDGMQKQMQSSVDRAVNAMSQRTWVGLSWEEIDECFKITPDQYLQAQIYTRIEAKLKQKNGYSEEKNI